MEFMFVTFCVLKPVTSRLVRPEQPENIQLMLVTFSVLRFSIPIMLVSEEHLSNQ